jgi:hypothetical protein
MIVECVHERCLCLLVEGRIAGTLHVNCDLLETGQALDASICMVHSLESLKPIENIFKAGHGSTQEHELHIRVEASKPREGGTSVNDEIGKFDAVVMTS